MCSGLLTSNRTCVPPLIALLQIGLASMIAGLLDTVVGFGGALLLIPMLAMIVGGHDAVLLAALIPLGWNVPRIVMLRKWIRWRVALLFAIGIVPGTYLGAALLGSIEPHILARCIGGMLVLFGAYYVGRLYIDLPQPRGMKEWAFPLVGLVSGVIGGILGAGHGPLQAGGLVASSMPIRDVAATNGALGAISALARVAGYGLEGMLYKELWIPALLGAAFACGGAIFGIRVARRSKDSTLELLVGVVLVIAGLKMLITG